MSSRSSRMPGTSLNYQSTNLDDAVEVPDDSWWSNVLSAGSLRNITLWGISLFCVALVWLGTCLFFYVLLSRYYLPESAHHSRSLYFDYTKADAVATAHFLPDKQYHQARSSEAAAAQARFLSAKQRFDVWVELAAPEAHSQKGDELFQVVGELLSADGRVAATSSRPCLVRQRYWLSRTFRFWRNAPFVLLGIWDERQDVRVPLFNNYVEQASTPFVVFRATLQPRAGGGRLPQLYEATVHLQLRLGLLSRLLSLTRPGNWVAWSLMSISVFSMVGGSLGCILLLSLWFLSKDSSTTPGQAAEKSWVPNGVDTDGEISEDESASAPELPSEMQGTVDDPAEIRQQYKDTNSNKIGGFPSQSSFVSDDSTFGAQEPHVTFSAQHRRHKKVM